MLIRCLAMVATAPVLSGAVFAQKIDCGQVPEPERRVCLEYSRVQALCAPKGAIDPAAVQTARQCVAQNLKTENLVIDCQIYPSPRREHCEAGNVARMQRVQ